MDLSLESCKCRLCQIDKTVMIFKNVAFSGSHFKSIYLLQARNISILDIVSTSYSLCQSFYHFIKHRPENKPVFNLSLQNEIDVLAYFTLTC